MQDSVAVTHKGAGDQFQASSLSEIRFFPIMSGFDKRGRFGGGKGCS